jgi:YidC/Oxa1 family membrane protein insertase
MDKRSLLAIVLCLIILIAYQELISYLYPPLPPQESPVPSERIVSSPAPSSVIPRPEAEQRPSPGVPPAAPVAHPEEQEITVENAVYRAVFSSRGARLKSLILKDYPGDAGEHSPSREMIRQGVGDNAPLEVRLGGNGTSMDDAGVVYAVEGGNIEFAGKVNDDDYLIGKSSSSTFQEQAILSFRGTFPDGTPIAKVFTFAADSYGIQLAVQVSQAPPDVSTLSLVWIENLDPTQSDDYYTTYGPVALVGRKFVYEGASGLDEPEILGPDQVRWAGFTDSYFLAAMMPPQGGQYRCSFRVVNNTARTTLSLPWAGESVSYTLYVGPKETEALNAVDPVFDRAIDFGWFHFIARPLISLLRVSHSLTGNYGLDIILLTVLVKLIFFPLSNKSFQSMAAMKKLQPQMERLRERYKDDRQKVNQETMQLYKRNKVNPLGGCLPMLVQFPVFIGLYQGLMYAIELRQAPFFGWITDLSSPDRLGSLAIPFVDPPGLPILTLFMGGSMLLQQWMTPMTTGDPIQQKMMMLMPVIFTVMFVNFPSGLVLYWLVNNVLSVAQQYWYNAQHVS